MVTYRKQGGEPTNVGCEVFGLANRGNLSLKRYGNPVPSYQVYSKNIKGVK